MIGWVLTVGADIKREHVYVFIGILLLFYLFMFLALMRAQSEMIALEKDIVTDLQKSDHQSSFYAYLEKPRFKHVKKYTWLVYWSGNIAVIAFLLKW